MNTDKEYKYRMILRPFDIGTYPKEGFVRYEDDNSRYGSIVMNRRLLVAEFNKWDLLSLTDIEDIKGKVFQDEDAYMFSVDFEPDLRRAKVTWTDEKGNLVEPPYFGSSIQIIMNVESGKWTEVEKTIYEEVIEECPQNFVGSHATDLYILKNAETTAIIERHYKLPNVMAVQFKDEVTGNPCWEIPFGYIPEWERIKKVCQQREK